MIIFSVLIVYKQLVIKIVMILGNYIWLKLLKALLSTDFSWCYSFIYNVKLHVYI